jgi:7-cyano-7-deazaguanine synthase in queuosine biosynthesis/intein/homing endonuclease
MVTAPPRRAIVLLSGGLDSATTLAMARAQGFECYALSVDYGQRHSAELDAARRVAAAAGVRDHRIMHVDLAGIGGSALTDSSIAVPELPTTGIPVTYVPARNTIMLSLALGWAEVLEATDVFVGVNAVDYSVSGDTQVWIRGSLGARLVSIAEACQLPQDDYETLAVDKDSLRVCWKRILGRFRHDVAGKRCFRVQLERGQRIDVTEDHSLFSLDAAGDICTVRGDEIAVGLPLVAPFDLTEQAVAWSDDLKVIDLIKFGPTPPHIKRRSSVVEDGAFLTNRLRRTQVPLSFPVTDDFLRIVGLWLAEGGKDPESKSRCLQFSVGGLKGAPELLRRYFGSFGVWVGKSPANDFDYRVESSVFYEVFRRLGLLGMAKSGSKRFPVCFWQLSQRQRRILIAGLWDGDGCQVWKREAPIYQKSHAIIDELYHCLLLDGIFCTVKPSAHSQKRLAITRSVDFSRFLELYPLWHPEKLESLRKGALVIGRDKTTGLWKSDAIWVAVANATLAAGIKTRVYNSGGKYDISVRAQRSAFAPISSLDRLRDSKLAFLRVVSIEPVSYEHMYDFSVEGAENFLANGFLAHNSGYPDCRPEYIAAFEQMAAKATKAGVEGNPCHIHAPLISLSKAEIIREGVRLGVDYGLTVSCYQADAAGRACGRCDSCRLRRDGFKAAGVADPTAYQ